MPNARDAHATAAHRFLMLGPTGGGKTTQVLTLPGRKFAYLFDPNALLSLRGHDVEYEEFPVENVSLDVVSLSKENQSRSKAVVKNNSSVYLRWEQDFSERVESGFFDDIDVVMMDSATTFLDLIMDYVLVVNNRAGSWPSQDDYGPQMVTFTNVCRTLTSLGKTIYFTGHLLLDKDDVSGRIFRLPVMTGRLKDKIPLLFSDILVCEHTTDKEGASQYTIMTKPDKLTPTVRCSIRGAPMFMDVTIDWSQPVEGQGLGGWVLSEQEVEEPPKKVKKGK